MSDNRINTFTVMPFSLMPNGATFVVLKESETLFKHDSDKWLRIYNDYRNAEGIRIKLGQFAFRDCPFDEAVELFPPAKLVLYGKTIEKSSGKKTFNPRDELLGRILTLKPAGITLEELRRSNRSEEKLAEIKNSLSFLEMFRYIRREGSQYILTGAGVRAALLNGFTHGPAPLRQPKPKGQAQA